MKIPSPPVCSAQNTSKCKNVAATFLSILLLYTLGKSRLHFKVFDQRIGHTTVVGDSMKRSSNTGLELRAVSPLLHLVIYRGVGTPG